ncbi:MAG: hypothetical protein IPI90_07655, partial [Saprospiraceae bacterium]|nr:hypothetical protein [Candidatus Vicinibacter affinis]
SIKTFCQTIKIEPFTINYPSKEKIDISICAPFKSYSIEGMNTPDDMGWTYDYYDESLRQYNELFNNLLSTSKYADCITESDQKPIYQLDCRLESISSGKVITAFSKLSLEIIMTWKLTRINDGEVIFREKVTGSHKNKIGNAFSGKSNAKERATKALEAAFLESKNMLTLRLKSL